LEAKI
jgi:hypothetical protein